MKWYSNGLTEKEAKKLEKRIAKIKKPEFGLDDRDQVGLFFGLSYENGLHTSWGLYSMEDIRKLLIETKSSSVSDLRGKVVEAYVKLDEGLNNQLYGISVNKHLI